MGNILGAGIRACTAFSLLEIAVFSVNFFGICLQIIPWVLQSVIGVSAIIYLSKKYRKNIELDTNSPIQKDTQTNLNQNEG